MIKTTWLTSRTSNYNFSKGRFSNKALNIPTFKSNYQDKWRLLWILNKTINPNNLINRQTDFLLKSPPVLPWSPDYKTANNNWLILFSSELFSQFKDKTPSCWRVRLFKLRQTERDFNYCLGLVWIRKSHNKWLSNLTDPFILTNINTTKTSILLFMSRLVPDWSQVKPSALVPHKSHLYLEIKDEQRTQGGVTRWHWTGSTRPIPALILRQNGRRSVTPASSLPSLDISPDEN